MRAAAKLPLKGETLKVLSIDTATQLLDLCLLIPPDRFYTHSSSAGLAHAQRLMPAIDSLLAEAKVSVGEIDLVVCARGPGSFTGLRIGMATAKGLCFAASKPLVSISTLDALAYRSWAYDGPVIPVLDARRSRVYCAIYSSGRRQSDYLDISPESLKSKISGEKRCLVTGVASETVDLVVSGLGDAIADPLVGVGAGPAMVKLGLERFMKGEIEESDSGPIYLRLSDAEEKRRAT